MKRCLTNKYVIMYEHKYYKCLCVGLQELDWMVEQMQEFAQSPDFAKEKARLLAEVSTPLQMHIFLCGRGGAFVRYTYTVCVFYKYHACVFDVY